MELFYYMNYLLICDGLYKMRICDLYIIFGHCHKVKIAFIRINSSYPVLSQHYKDLIAQGQRFSATYVLIIVLKNMRAREKVIFTSKYISMK